MAIIGLSEVVRRGRADGLAGGLGLCCHLRREVVAGWVIISMYAAWLRAILRA